jgi:hypothetical protein
VFVYDLQERWWFRDFLTVSLLLTAFMNAFSVGSATISCGRVFHSFTIVRRAVTCDRPSRGDTSATFICRPFVCRVDRRAYSGTTQHQIGAAACVIVSIVVVVGVFVAAAAVVMLLCTYVYIRRKRSTTAIAAIVLSSGGV